MVCSYRLCKIRGCRASRTHHQSSFGGFRRLPYVLYAVTRHQPPPARHPGGSVPSGGYASRAPERTAPQVARVPGPQPLMSDSPAARKDVAVQQWARSISNKHVHWGSTRLLSKFPTGPFQNTKDRPNRLNTAHSSSDARPASSH
jgi:hypothetical protein